MLFCYTVFPVPLKNMALGKPGDISSDKVTFLLHNPFFHTIPIVLVSPTEEPGRLTYFSWRTILKKLTELFKENQGDLTHLSKHAGCVRGRMVSTLTIFLIFYLYIFLKHLKNHDIWWRGNVRPFLWILLFLFQVGKEIIFDISHGEFSK